MAKRSSAYEAWALQQIKAKADEGLCANEICEALGISKPFAYRIIKANQISLQRKRYASSSEPRRMLISHVDPGLYAAVKSTAARLNISMSQFVASSCEERLKLFPDEALMAAE